MKCKRVDCFYKWKDKKLVGVPSNPCYYNAIASDFCGC